MVLIVVKNISAEWLTRLINRQKTEKKNAWQIMTQTENRHITCIGLSAICVDVQCHKTCMWMVLKGEKTSLNLIRNSYKEI